jgi:hypothetical protein
MRTLTMVLAALALVLAAPSMAQPPGKGRDKARHAEPHRADTDAGRGGQGQARDPGKSRERGKGHRGFSTGERDQIRAYFAANPSDRQQLPPGLAKKNKIPPGWQKKLAPGYRLPDDVWAHRVPLPHEILAQLPPPPAGVVLVRIHDRVLKVAEKTREVLDDVGLPHPPTPPRLPR